MTRPAGLVFGAAMLVALLAPPPESAAQPRGDAGDNDRERGFVEALRREDPSAADRYVALRDARTHATAELQQAEARYRAAGPEFRGMVLAQLRQAQRKYAETSLALVDFLDARDRQILARYQEEIGRINGALAERARARADLEKLLKE